MFRSGQTSTTKDNMKYGYADKNHLQLCTAHAIDCLGGGTREKTRTKEFQPLYFL